MNSKKYLCRLIGWWPVIQTARIQSPTGRSILIQCNDWTGGREIAAICRKVAGTQPLDTSGWTDRQELPEILLNHEQMLLLKQVGEKTRQLIDYHD